MAEEKEKKLTRKEQKFCNQYSIHFNGTRAAIEAGYSPKSAANIAWENVRKPHIKNYIALLTEQALADAGVNQRRVLEEYARIAYFNPKQLFDEKGNPIPIHLLDDSTASILSSLEYNETEVKTNKRTKTTVFVKKVKWASKEAALFNLMKHLGLAKEQIDITSKGNELAGLTETTIMKTTLNIT